MYNDLNTKSDHRHNDPRLAKLSDSNLYIYSGGIY